MKTITQKSDPSQDTVIREVRRVKEKLARQHGFDVLGFGFGACGPWSLGHKLLQFSVRLRRCGQIARLGLTLPQLDQFIFVSSFDWSKRSLHRGIVIRFQARKIGVNSKTKRRNSERQGGYQDQATFHGKKRFTVCLRQTADGFFLGH